MWTQLDESGRSVPRDRRNAIEVIIAAGEVDQAMLRHDCNNQRVAGKELMLLAYRCGVLNQRLGDWKHLDGHERDAGKGPAINAQTGDLGMVFSQPCSDPSHGPALQADRFERHQAVGHVGHDVRRGEAAHLLEFDALQDLGTGQPYLGSLVKW